MRIYLKTRRLSSCGADDHLSFYIDRWALLPAGDPIITPSSRLLPVLRHGEPAMLKVATVPEEKWGAGLMIWWDGVGAARVLEHDDDAILLERATGRCSLADMASHGQDDEASLIICGAIAGLHTPSKGTLAEAHSAVRLVSGAHRHARRRIIRSLCRRCALAPGRASRCRSAPWGSPSWERTRLRRARLARHRPQAAGG